jgi:hypothetical protein
MTAQPSPRPPMPEDRWGCSRKCLDHHTHVWGQCELATDPGPSPLLIAETSIAGDGWPSTVIRAATAEELAAHPAVVKLVNPDGEEEFATPDMYRPTASDLALVAFATGGHHGVISAEYIPEPYEGDEFDTQLAHDTMRGLLDGIHALKKALTPPAAPDDQVRNWSLYTGDEYGGIYCGDPECGCDAVRAGALGGVQVATPSDPPHSLRRDRKLHMAAARAELVVEYPGQDCSSSLVAARANDPGFRAAVDEAVRLTEQRVRAEIGADPETCPVDHTCDDEGSCGCWCELHDCPIADCPTYQLVTAWLNRAAADLAAMTARAESAEARAGWVDVSQLADAGTREQCCNCGHERFTPTGPLAPLATEIMANIRQVLGHLRQEDEAYQVNLRTLANDHVTAEAVAAYAIETTLKRFTAPDYSMRPEELALAVVDALRATGHLDRDARAECADGEAADAQRDAERTGAPSASAD